MTRRLRSRHVRALRGPLTDAEIRELLAGHAESEFPSAAAFLAGRARLLAEMEEWDELRWWEFGYHPDGSPIGAGLLEGEALAELARAALREHGRTLWARGYAAQVRGDSLEGPA